MKEKKNINLNPHKDDDTKNAPTGMGSQYKALAMFQMHMERLFVLIKKNKMF
jgi:hypothetical protein